MEWGRLRDVKILDGVGWRETRRAPPEMTTTAATPPMHAPPAPPIRSLEELRAKGLAGVEVTEDVAVTIWYGDGTSESVGPGSLDTTPVPCRADHEEGLERRRERHRQTDRGSGTRRASSSAGRGGSQPNSSVSTGRVITYLLPIRFAGSSPRWTSSYAVERPTPSRAAASGIV